MWKWPKVWSAKNMHYASWVDCWPVILFIHSWFVAKNYNFSLPNIWSQLQQLTFLPVNPSRVAVAELVMTPSCWLIRNVDLCWNSSFWRFSLFLAVFIYQCFDAWMVQINMPHKKAWFIVLLIFITIKLLKGKYNMFICGFSQLHLWTSIKPP